MPLKELLLSKRLLTNYEGFDYGNSIFIVHGLLSILFEIFENQSNVTHDIKEKM